MLNFKGVGCLFSAIDCSVFLLLPPRSMVKTAHREVPTVSELTVFKFARSAAEIHSRSMNAGEREANLGRELNLVNSRSSVSLTEITRALLAPSNLIALS